MTQQSTPLKITGIALALALVGGCASTTALDEIRWIAESAQAEATEARAMAAQAQSTANQGLVAANEAKQDSAEAKRQSEEVQREMNRMFRRSIQ